MGRTSNKKQAQKVTEASPEPESTPASYSSDSPQLRDALASLIASGMKADGQPVKSIRSAAADHDVPFSTLRRRWNGVRSRSQAHVAQMLLTPPQERGLADWAKELAKRAIPWTKDTLREKAQLICKKQVSDNWIYRFIKRNPDLKLRWTQGLESPRAGALNEAIVAEFYRILAETVEKYQVKPENIYNMDEKGVQLGIGMRARVLVDRNQKNVHTVTDGNKELVTMLETVSANGAALPPMAIFKGKRCKALWGQNNSIDAQ